MGIVKYIATTEMMELEMKSAIPPQLYKKFFIDKSDERKMLFEKIASSYHPQNGIYPGSFVHITPSLYIKNMTYVDSDNRVAKFYADETLKKYIDENKIYSESSTIHGIQADYSNSLPIEEGSFDIMFSFYAGFISQICKKYLKENGILVCNNSHGDASLAALDGDYSLIAVIKRNGENFRIIEDDLDSYFVKKDGSPIDREKVKRKMRGENFTKKGYAYVFRYSRRR